jgi:hypothetical protein
MGFGDILKMLGGGLSGAGSDNPFGAAMGGLSGMGGGGMGALGTGLGALLGKLFGHGDGPKATADNSQAMLGGPKDTLGGMQTNPVASKMPLGGINYAADPFAGGQKQDFGAMLRQFLGNLQ